MSVVVVRLVLAVDEVDEACDTGPAVRTRQIVVLGHDAGVNDRDANASTVVPEILVNHRGAHRGPGSFHRAGNGTILGNLSDQRMASQCQERRVGQIGDRGADERKRPARSTAGHTNQRGDRIRRGAVGSSDNHS